MNWKQNQRQLTNELPPYSRIFVVCSKQQRISELRSAFERFGEIEDMHMPVQRATGESKGIAYIKYAKTSSAATAIKEMHLRSIENSTKPVKVMVAVTKNDNVNASEERYKRLFVKVHLGATEKEIFEHFSQFGSVNSIHLQRNRETEELRGFAYVNFKTFLDAAKAFEGCDKKYKPIFATPKDELKRNRNSIEDNYQSSNSSIVRDNHNDYYGPPRDNMHSRDSFSSLIDSKSQGYETVCVTCSPPVPQRFLESLFKIIPGMSHFKYTSDNFNGFARATITYETEKSAAYAVETLHRFEFPSGEILSVKPDDNPLSKAANNLTSIVNSFKNAVENSDPNLAQLADAIAQASSLIKAAAGGKEQLGTNCQDTSLCSVRLPPKQPIADSHSKAALRCYFLCLPHPPPTHILRDAFCRFGDLIDICTFPDKKYGFVRYASVRSAQEAIKTLNRATLHGVTLKVVEANEKYPKTEKIDDASSDHNSDPKRMKLDDTLMWDEEDNTKS